MTTVDKFFADNIVLNNGFYNGDDYNPMGDNLEVIRIWAYTNMYGGHSYKLISSPWDRCYDGRDLYQSGLYWEKK